MTVDIYTNDPHTRRPATHAEILWTVRLIGCSGSMLAPNILLTANHCEPGAGETYTSGAALSQGKNGDLKGIRVLERSYSFDYALVEVKWSNESMKKLQKYIPLIQRSAADLKMGPDHQSSPLFTVGFPADKDLQPAFSQGFAKNYIDSYLHFNLGAINGNSGGAVLRPDNFMLVSQTNFGPHQYREEGWDNNDPEDSKAWNGGGRMDRIYMASTVLKKIFLDGKNKLTDASGTLLDHFNSQAADLNFSKETIFVEGAEGIPSGKRYLHSTEEQRTSRY